MLVVRLYLSLTVFFMGGSVQNTIVGNLNFSNFFSDRLMLVAFEEYWSKILFTKKRQVVKRDIQRIILVILNMTLSVIMLDAIFLLALEVPQKPFVNVITYHLVTLNNLLQFVWYSVELLILNYYILWSKIFLLKSNLNYLFIWQHWRDLKT